MTTGRNASSGAIPQGTANPLGYAEGKGRAPTSAEALARNVLVMVLRLVGLLILLPALWSTLDELLRAAMVLSGIGSPYWGGWESFFEEAFFDQLATYLLGALVFVIAQPLAPVLMPRHWWR